MTVHTRFTYVAAAATLAAAVSLTGCSSSGSTTPSASPSTPMPSASPSDPGSTVLPPIIIDGKETAVAAKVGDNLDVVTADATSVSTDNATVLEVSQPRDDGSATFNAGAKVIAAGTAVLTVSGASGELYKVTVTATE